MKRKKKKKEESRCSGKEGVINYVEFIRNLMRALKVEEREVNNLTNFNFAMIIKHLEKEKVIKEVGQIWLPMPKDKGDFFMDWKKICMEDVGDFLIFILLFGKLQSDVIDLDKPNPSVNTNSNHVFKEITQARTFMIWSIQSFPNFKENDLILFKMFLETLEKLALKMYKKCYYFETPKGTKSLQKKDGFYRLKKEKEQCEKEK